MKICIYFYKYSNIKMNYIKLNCTIIHAVMISNIYKIES